MTNKKHYNSLEDEMSDEMERRATRYSRNERMWKWGTIIITSAFLGYLGWHVIIAL